MKVFEYLLRYPYRAAWKISKIFSKNKRIDFFCAGQVDYICFKNIHYKMPFVRIVAKNRKVKSTLKNFGIDSVLYPTFPDVVIMARHSTAKFPAKKIKKIGIRHGAYHFKDFINAKHYNEFDKYLMTSQKEVELAEAKGIHSSKAVGFPKIDSMFNGKITEMQLTKLRKSLNLDSSKPTILFTATWNKKGYSAIDKWVGRLAEIVDDYNVLVTVHQWTTPDKKQILENTKKINYIKDKDILPFLMIANVMIADISSIIAEFNSLDKPIVTYKVPHMKRFTQEISGMLDEISYRVDSFEEMKVALKKAIKNPDEHSVKRRFYNKIMFDDLDGKASERAVEEIREYWRF